MTEKRVLIYGEICVVEEPMVDKESRQHGNVHEYVWKDLDNLTILRSKDPTSYVSICPDSTTGFGVRYKYDPDFLDMLTSNSFSLKQ